MANTCEDSVFGRQPSFLVLLQRECYAPVAFGVYAAGVKRTVKRVVFDLHRSWSGPGQTSACKPCWRILLRLNLLSLWTAAQHPFAKPPLAENTLQASQKLQRVFNFIDHNSRVDEQYKKTGVEYCLSVRRLFVLT